MSARRAPAARTLRLVGLVGLASLVGLAACRPPATAADGPLADAQRVARERMAAEQSIDVDSLPERTVGVTPFAVDARDTLLTPLAYGLADLLMTDLARSGRLVVVDRLRLDALLRELSLASSVDASTAPRAGRLLGARRLVVGALGRDGARGIRVDARVADVASGEVAGAVSGTASLDDVLEAEKTLAFRVLDALGVTLTPAERAAVEQRPTRNAAALVAFGRGVRWEVIGDYDRALAAYQQAVRLDPDFARARERLEAVRAVAGTPAARLAARQAAGGIPQELPVDALRRVGDVTADALNRTFYETVRSGRIGGGATDPATSALIADLGIIIAGAAGPP